MFDLRDMSIPVAWPVRGKCPLPDGTVQPFEFTAFWLYPQRTELDALLASNKGSLIRQGFIPSNAFHAITEAYLRGWQDLTSQGTPLSFTVPEDKELVMGLDFIRSALMASFFAMLGGEGGRKNFEPLAGSGPGEDTPLQE